MREARPQANSTPPRGQATGIPDEPGTKRISRRGLLLSAVLAGQSVMVAASTQAQRSRAYFREFAGFDSLSRARYYELVANYTESPLVLTAGEPDAAGRPTYRFSLSRETPVFLSATVSGVEPIFVHPLIVRRDDGPRLLLPLIRPATPDRSITSSIQLGMCEAGDHSFSIEQNAASSMPLPDSLVLRIARPEPDSLLASFLAHTPVIEIKNAANVLDDIPLMAFAKIFRLGDAYKMTTFVIFSSENGGTMPARLLDTYQRTVDIEWVTQQLYSPDGRPEPGRLAFQTVHHGFERFAGRQVLGSHPSLSIASQNNNFTDGVVRVLGMTLPSYFSSETRDPILYAPKPRFLPPAEWGIGLLSEYPELQRWSLFELTMEGCVTDNGRVDPGEAKFFADLAIIEQQLNVTFRSRGCRQRLSVISSDD